MSEPQGEMSIATWLMLGTALVWIVIDVFLYVNRKKVATISEVITHFARYSPMLPFILGVLMGHWLW